ncbi:Acetyltransferase (GNAT) family protein [Monaibacterium marinum]|uniref:Acetyltransferase (GNAT) family protein n=1 Tax=Pontivivens marinum TaxID=1690039 RepID=A0A2C9CVR4_9RHOB|nr:GNAT family N-acetyltransferase [Monaibacterium marinum]SOH95290.1 Acetyltransferase (GNAT) family protein [Monaibacterium marinum]
MRREAGEEVEFTITFLEMTSRPDYPRPSVPGGPPVALLRAEGPPNRYFLDLYRGVGSNWEWNDRLRQSPEDLHAFVGSPDVHIYTLMRDGWSAGFFTLDFREEATCDLAYFGLMPEVIGAGLGTWMLRTAIHTAWDGVGVQRVTVNTCTLDHPRALQLYQKHGYSPIRQETATTVLTAPRDMP